MPINYQALANSQVLKELNGYMPPVSDSQALWQSVLKGAKGMGAFALGLAAEGVGAERGMMGGSAVLEGLGHPEIVKAALKSIQSQTGIDNTLAKRFFKISAISNNDMRLLSRGHPLLEMAGSSIPLVAGMMLTGGLGGVLEGATEAGIAEPMELMNDVNAGISEASTPEEATQAANDAMQAAKEGKSGLIARTIAKAQRAKQIGYNAATNLKIPGGWLTEAMARNMPINAAFSAQGALQLDGSGNVMLNKKEFLDGLALNTVLSATIPALGRAAKLGYRSITRTRVTNKVPTPRIAPDAPATIPVPKTLKDIPDFEATEVDTHNLVSPHTTSDVSFPETEATQQMLSSPDELKNPDTFWKTVAGVKDLKEHGVEVDGVNYKADDSSLHGLLDNTIKSGQQLQDQRGMVRTSLTKFVDSKPKEKLTPYRFVLKHMVKIPYRSKGAIEHETNEYFYHFPDDKYKLEDMQKLQKMVQDDPKDEIGTAILSLRNQSLAKEADGNLARLKGMRQSLQLYKAGILDEAKNWTANDTEKINKFTHKVMTQYSDYFMNPLSSGYLKLSANLPVFRSLVNCLIKGM